MYSLLSILFGLGLAVLVYGLSLFPTASLTPSEDPDELASLMDRENIDPFADDSRALSSGRPPERAG